MKEMRRIQKFYWSCLLMWLFLVFSCSTKTPLNGENQFLIGVSSNEINPPLGAFIAGDRQNRTFTGVLDSLYAKAVVAYDGQEAIALVTLDCIGLLYQDLLTIRTKVAETSFPIPLLPENIIISSTHTHSGPDVVGLWGKDYSKSGVDKVYLERLTDVVVAQISTAASSLKPARGYYAQTTYGNGWVENICGEEIDRSVTTLVFENFEGIPLVSMTNFACHPTFLDATFSEISADFVAGYYKEMKRNLPGEHLFLQGAIGGWIQPVIEKRDYITALEKGAGLAMATLDALQNKNYLQHHTIFLHSKKVMLPIANNNWKNLLAAGIINRPLSDSLETEVAWLQIGEATFATHPGETAPSFGLETKALMGPGPKFVLGLSQDALGYILKPSYFKDSLMPHSTYLTSMSLGPETGPLLIKSLEELSSGTTFK
jgi:hypothetical protein